MPKDATFLEYTEDIVRNFINTAVFIDEEAYFPGEEEEEHQPERKELLAPQYGLGSTGHFDMFTPVAHGSDVVEQAEDTAEDVRNTDNIISHVLNAKNVMDVFAKNGIICSILKPEDPNEITSDLLNSAKKADVIILDWDLFTKDGSLAKKIINNIISTDCNQAKRLRLILIYTAESVPDVFENLTNKEFVTAHPSLKTDDGEFIVTIDYCKIVIYTKAWSNSSGLTHSVTIEDLPNTIVKEFAQMSAGLLSNVAIQSVATIRNNTHQLLANLKDTYDPAFITHRVLLEIPDASQDFSEEIIISEISSLLESNQVSDIANGDAIQKWIEYKNILESESYPISIFDNINNTPVDAVISREGVISVIDRGLPKAVRAGLSAQKTTSEGSETLKIGEESYGFISTLLCQNDPDKAELVNKKFSSLTTVKRFYKDSNHQPFLTLGTIIKEKTEHGKGKFWLCITPRCDCERIPSDGKEFSFLKLQPRNEGKSVDIIVEVKENEFSKFEISYRSHESKLICFNGEEKSKRAVVEKEDDVYILKAYPKKASVTKYEWIGELKRDYAQRIANRYASKISRIGLDEYEWLRRLSRHTD